MNQEIGVTFNGLSRKCGTDAILIDFNTFRDRVTLAMCGEEAERLRDALSERYRKGAGWVGTGKATPMEVEVTYAGQHNGKVNVDVKWVNGGDTYTRAYIISKAEAETIGLVAGLCRPDVCDTIAEGPPPRHNFCPECGTRCQFCPECGERLR